MYNEEQEIDNSMAQWMASKRFTNDAKTNAAIRQRVEDNLEQLGGYCSIASWERAYLELLNEDEIQPFRGTVAEKSTAAPAISPETIAFITSPRTSSSELRRRYYSDQTFRQQYDLFEKTKGKRPEEQSVAPLSVEDYRRLPAAVVVQKYRQNGVFRAQVDALIKAGKI